MRDSKELTRPSPDATGGAGAGSDAHRVFLLECRLEQMRTSVDEARAQAHGARALLAEAAAREAEHARRFQNLHEELAAARAEIAALHRRLEHSEALRAGLEGRLFESTTPEDAHELVRLRTEAVAAQDMTATRQRAAASLQARVEEVVASRETLLSRVAEWQCATRQGDAEAVDLAEFIAVLSRDVLALEHRCLAAERRESELREQLAEAAPGAGTRPEAGPDSAAEAEQASTPEPATRTRAADEPPAVGSVVHDTDDAEYRIDALLRLGRSGDAGAFAAIHPALGAAEPRVRAAAYQALGHLFEREPSRLEPHIRRGIADADPRVRRRVVLAAAAARGLSLRPLLDPLGRDPDHQVRRLVNEVLRRTPSASDNRHEKSAEVPETIKAGVAS